MHVSHKDGAAPGRNSWLLLPYGHGHAAEVLARPLGWCNLSGALSVVVSSQINVLIRY